jgi:hypothetical protein
MDELQEVLTKIADRICSKFDQINSNLQAINNRLGNTARDITYTPGNAANWVSPGPTTTAQAVDRLAAKVKALAGGPIP